MVEMKSIGRRGFLRAALSAGFANSLVATQRLYARHEPRGPYLDIHTHIGRTWNEGPALTPEALVRWMDEHNVVKAVVLPLVSPESSSYLNLTEQALAAAKRFPDRLDPILLHRPANVVHRRPGRVANDAEGIRRSGRQGVWRAQGRIADRSCRR